MPRKSGEPPRPSDEELLELLRHTSRKGFPNPDRKDCPSEEVLRTLALHPGQVSVKDPVIHHATHCSPCFAEMERLRARNKKAG